MGLWDFVKSAGKALGIGAAEAEEAPAPEALKKEVGDLGLKPEGLDDRRSTGDTVKVSGRAPTQEEKEKIILAVGNVAGVAKVEEALETPGARGRAGVPHRGQGRQPLEDRREDPGQGRALQGDLRGEPADAERSGQDLPGPGAAHPGEVATGGAVGAPGLVRLRASFHYRRTKRRRDRAGRSA